MITLFGATGFTGRLIASALARDHLPFRIAGRSFDKLAALSVENPAHPAWLVADARRPETLPALFHDTRLLINCAGPFTDLGERVISHAAMGGVHYLDLTNELGYLFKVRGYHEMARRTGAALVPACGFEVALADCLAGQLARSWSGLSEQSPLDQVNIIYSLSGGSSTGTRLSAMRSLGTSWIRYENGGWSGAIPGGRTKQFSLPGGEKTAFSFPSCESITVPLHTPTENVNVWMTAGKGARYWAPVVIPLMARLTRSVLRDAILGATRRAGRDPGENREDSRFSITVETAHDGMTRSATLQGGDPYGLTAEIAAYVSSRLLRPDFSKAGLLAPSQAVDAGELLTNAAENWSITLSEQRATT